LLAHSDEAEEQLIGMLDGMRSKPGEIDRQLVMEEYGQRYFDDQIWVKAKSDEGYKVEISAHKILM
jgi:hypothetical protein